MRSTPFTIRVGRSRVARSIVLGLATLAASLGFPIKVEPPPGRRTPVEVVRDEGDRTGCRRSATPPESATAAIRTPR